MMIGFHTQGNLVGVGECISKPNKHIKLHRCILIIKNGYKIVFSNREDLRECWWNAGMDLKLRISQEKYKSIIKLLFSPAPNN